MNRETNRSPRLQTEPPSRLPEWQVSEWLNTESPLKVASLLGRVVLLHAFQMLCPGCVSYGLPQAERVRQLFPEHDVAVVGLHTVFEHHDVMNTQALRAFVHEYRWSFPIGVDSSVPDDDIPLTMRAYGLRGTPSHILLDRNGLVRALHFGRMDDLELGSVIGRLIAESGDDLALADKGATDRRLVPAGPGGCSEEGCAADSPDRV